MLHMPCETSIVKISFPKICTSSFVVLVRQFCFTHHTIFFPHCGFPAAEFLCCYFLLDGPRIWFNGSSNTQTAPIWIEVDILSLGCLTELLSLPSTPSGIYWIMRFIIVFRWNNGLPYLVVR